MTKMFAFLCSYFASICSIRCSSTRESFLYEQMHLARMNACMAAIIAAAVTVVILLIQVVLALLGIAAFVVKINTVKFVTEKTISPELFLERPPDFVSVVALGPGTKNCFSSHGSISYQALRTTLLLIDFLCFPHSGKVQKSFTIPTFSGVGAGGSGWKVMLFIEMPSMLMKQSPE